MKRLGAVVLWACLCAAVLPAQVEQLATSGDGRVLVFHTFWRLQGEPELGAQGKVYRWQDGVWTRLAAARSAEGFAISPPDLFRPFLSTDARVAGWQISIGCILCQTVVGPAYSSEVSGVTLPPGFPRGTLRMSANGRYFTADNYPQPGVQYLDVDTGLIVDVPVDLFTRPVVRELANDGTALLLVTGAKDAGQSIAPGVLSLWKPGSGPQPIYGESRVLDPTISATQGKVAFEAVSEDGTHLLLVIDTQTGERIPVADLPSRPYQSGLESFAQPRWDANGSQLLYLSADAQGNLVNLSLWERASRTSRVLLTSPEGWTDAVISGDGTTVWAVTTANRLLRLDLATTQVEEILPPSGGATRYSVSGNGVPGSAILIRGTGFTKVQTVFDGGQQLPVSAVTPEGLWVQVPWEYAALPQSVHPLLVQSGNSPFEAVIPVSILPEAVPQITLWNDPATNRSYAKAVHQDFRSVVTPASPARPGETVHVYLTGLGALDQPLATGAPGPLVPLLHPVTPLQCRLLGTPPQLLAMPYVGYAVGLVGIYQADLTIPEGVTTGTQQLVCTVTNPSGNIYSSAAPLSTTATP